MDSSAASTTRRARLSVEALTDAVVANDIGRLVAVWLVISAIFAVAAPHFLSVSNFLNLGLAMSIQGIAAMGVTLALISGSLDLSFPVVISASVVVLARMVSDGASEIPTILLVLGLGGAIGLLNGVLCVRLRIDALLVTLATGTALANALVLIAEMRQTALPGELFAEMGRGRLAGIPVPALLLLAAFAVAFLFLRWSVPGQAAFAVGNNQAAARNAGLPVDGIRILMLVICSVFAAFAGVVMVSVNGYATAADGDVLLLPVLAAVILGGTSLRGGKGSVVATLLGLLIFATVENGLNILNVGPFVKAVVIGVIVLLALVYYSRFDPRR
jgi:ribose transport system permease protein